MLIGYMRVSKADGSQSTDLQRDALLAAGVDPLKLYEDHASGKKDDRPQLAACLKGLRAGDTLLVWKLDRLGRDLRHLVNTVHDLTERGIGLKVLTGRGRGHRHHHGLGQARLRDLRRPGRVRTRTDLRAHRRRPGLGPRPRTHRRPALQDDPGQGPPGHGRHGATRKPRSAPSARNSASPGKPSTATSPRPGSCGPTAQKLLKSK